MAENQTYTVKRAREIAGLWRSIGETVQLTAGQAKYYLPPYAEDLALENGEGAEASRKPRRSAKTDAPEVDAD